MALGAMVVSFLWPLSLNFTVMPQYHFISQHTPKLLFQQGRCQSQWSSQYIFSPRLIHTYITHGLIPRSNVVFYHHQHSPTMVLLSHPLSFLHVLSIPFIILGIVNPLRWRNFNAKSQFSWVDSSCDSVIDRVNNAGDDYNALVRL